LLGANFDRVVLDLFHHPAFGRVAVPVPQPIV
jgi:hypothetical protein